MTPQVALTDFGGAGAPLVVLGPSLGTSVRALWHEAAARLTGRYHVVGWDLPGHGDSARAARFGVGDLAAAVLDALPGTFEYAGVSLGGAVGLHLLLDAPDRVTRATLLATAPRFGEPADWHERAARVRREGTGFLVEMSPGRWFAAGNRSLPVVRALLTDLARADAVSYAAACDALAAFDVRPRLAEITAPVLAVAGSEDAVTPPSALRHLADGVRHGELVVLDGVAHQAPAERPGEVAALISRHVPPDRTTSAEVRAEGMRIRREVLGDAYVDRASETADGLGADFQEFITRYAWGSVWNRTGLDRRSRSLITLTALVAGAHHEELALHLRAALRNGVTRDEIKELLLQTAIYCGVPAANTAFRIARQVFAEDA